MNVLVGGEGESRAEFDFVVFLGPGFSLDGGHPLYVGADGCGSCMGCADFF